MIDRTRGWAEIYASRLLTLTKPATLRGQRCHGSLYNINASLKVFHLRPLPAPESRANTRLAMASPSLLSLLQDISDPLTRQYLAQYSHGTSEQRKQRKTEDTEAAKRSKEIDQWLRAEKFTQQKERRKQRVVRIILVGMSITFFIINRYPIIVTQANQNLESQLQLKTFNLNILLYPSGLNAGHGRGSFTSTSSGPFVAFTAHFHLFLRANYYHKISPPIRPTHVVSYERPHQLRRMTTMG